jgi:murein L,D-transpeptidase YcbB/YkuD
MRSSFPFAILLAAATLVAACRPSPITTPELQALVNADAAPRGVSRDVWRDVQAFYSARAQTLAWVSADGPGELTIEALDALRAAEQHGLDAAVYGEPELRKRVESLQDGNESPERAQALADLDVRLTSGLLQLGRHVATGRLSPRVIDPRWNSKREPPDYVAALQAASQGGVASFLDAVQPKHPEYAALRTALVSLRGQTAKGWPSVPPVTLKVGRWSEAVLPLRQRLAAGGYLPAHASLDSTQFDADVEAAVKAFQEHHSLAPTGVLDRATIQKMNVPLEARIAQVAINLERWRWLPDDLGARHLLINIPDFHLFAREHGTVTLDMRVVVGKRGNETPLFSDVMETVVFSPYWNVPETIALEETAPAVASDPDFLARNNMEVVNAAGEVVPPETIPWGDEGALADYRFRQRPGANNALGHVKFLFPNKHAVYLHDTPADALFKRIGRAFSHGCVRVEEPHVLAKYVLRDQPEWTDEAIRVAMHEGEERHVKLAEKIPVHIVYMTAWVDERGGLHFEDDVYHYDARQAHR